MCGAEQEKDLLRAFRARLFDVQTELDKAKSKTEDSSAVGVGATPIPLPPNAHTRAYTLHTVVLPLDTRACWVLSVLPPSLGLAPGMVILLRAHAQTWVERVQQLEKELDWAREMADRCVRDWEQPQLRAFLGKRGAPPAPAFANTLIHTPLVGTVRVPGWTVTIRASPEKTPG
jgi:hypothetical protein